MTQAPEQIAYTIKLSSPDQPDPDRIERVTRNLRSEIQELAPGSVASAADGAAPEGGKGGPNFLTGVMLFHAVAGQVPKLLEYLQSWLMRGQNQTIKIEIQRGENKINLSYTPASTTHEDIRDLIKQLNRNLK